MFSWIKSPMPRGLYGRAALIVAVPFFALQILISVVFIQRHFEDVTRQMVDAHSIAMRHLLTEISTRGLEDAAGEVGASLGMEITEADAVPVTSGKIWYDISGFTIIARLDELFDLRVVDLSNIRRVVAYVDWQGTTYAVAFDRRRVSARNPHQLLVLMVVAGAFMIIIAFVFLRNQLRPIRRLAEAAQAFGRGRTPTYHPTGAAEVRAAGSAFLDMRSRIERQIEQRTLLLSGVSHDLRTPLTRMRLGLSMMEGEEAAALRHDVDDMGKMIDSFLDFARVGAAEEAVETDLGSLLSEAYEDARRSGIELDLDGAIPQAKVSVRPLGLRRTIDNLITNGARYGSRVRLGCTILDRSIRIRVEDDGPGIAPEDREAAMRPFTRLDESRNQNQGGSVGLGLAMAADTARRHGGTLRLSESPDLGGLCADLVLAK